MRFNSFGDWAIGFTTILRAREVADQYLIKHEFMKRLVVRYEEEGIRIPFPLVRVSTDEQLDAEFRALGDEARRR